MRYVLVFFLTLTSMMCMATPEVEPRINSLLDSCTELCRRRDYKNLSTETEKLLAITTITQPDQHTMSRAYFYGGVADLMYTFSPRALQRLTNSYELAMAISNDSLSALALNSLGIYYAYHQGSYTIGQDYLLNAMETAERVKEYELMNAIWANLSHLAFLQQDSSGMLYARLSYNENLRLAYDRGIANSAICMAEQFSLREQPDSVDHYLRQALTIARSGNYGDNHRIWLAYAADCTMRGDLVRASEYLDSISPDTSDPEKTIAVAYERANIAAKHGNYSVAANLSKSGLTEAKTLKLHIYDNKLLSLLAQCSRHLGHYEVADSCLSQILHNKSLENEDIAKLMTRQRSMLLEIHQRQQSEMLKRQQIQSQRKVILLLTIALILALVLSVYIYWSVRRRQRLYRLIVEKQREALAQRELKKNPSTTHKSDMENGLPDSASEELWQRLEVLLIDEGLYRSPLLNRDMLAERLKTNRTYLSRVIKDHTGLSLPNYVTKLRIEYAVKAISQSSGKSVVLKNLAEEAGFANQATFIRAFKAQVGMSPSQFKSQCDQIDRDSSDTSSMGELELMDKQNSAVELTI